MWMECVQWIKVNITINSTSPSILLLPPCDLSVNTINCGCVCVDGMCWVNKGITDCMYITINSTSPSIILLPPCDLSVNTVNCTPDALS